MAHKPRHHYTLDELREAEIADLETDIRCAVRDGLSAYADKCRERLRILKEETSQRA